MKSVYLAFWLSGFLALAGCDQVPAAPQPGAPTLAIVPTPAKAAIDAASAAIWKESKVRNLDYRPDDTVQWIVAVKDTGSPQFGYASYICLVLGEHGALLPATAVRIADASLQGKLGEASRDASLGAIRCSDEEHLDAAPAVG